MKALICPSLASCENAQGDGCRAPGGRPGRSLGRRRLCGAQLLRHPHHRGQVQVKPTPPFSPAGEFSGRVAAVGAGGHGLRVGDRYGLIRLTGPRASGSQFRRGARSCAQRPAARQGGGSSVTYGTTIHACSSAGNEARRDPRRARGLGRRRTRRGRDRGRWARESSPALVRTKSSSSPAVRRDETINYATRIRAGLKELTGGKGATSSTTPSAAALTEQALRSLAWKRRLLVIGFASGEIPRIAAQRDPAQGLRHPGVYWGEPPPGSPRPTATIFRELLKWAQSGAISVHIHAKYSLEHYREAFETAPPDTRRAAPFWAAGRTHNKSRA